MAEGRPAIRVAILAPTPALRSGLRGLLAAGEDIDVFAEAAVAEQLALLDEVDVLVLLGAEGALPELRPWLEELDTPAGLVLLSEEPRAARSLAALPVRAWGLLPPEAAEEELLAAVAAVHEGLLAGAPGLLGPLLGAPASPDEDALPAEALSERESQVLQLLAEGLPNKQIALELGISEHTAKFHVSSIYAKLGVTNRTEALRRGARLGLITL
ncbi:MAG: response regulator transcription factor [Anaerolineales bacterium]|nr:response regulator transcription factor [Anaerolineales bacterium]